MADNLTQALKKELARRGRIVTDAEISMFLQRQQSAQPVPQQAAQPVPQQSSVIRRGPAPVVDQRQQRALEGVGSNLLNAAGAGLWSFLDVAAFGIPGAFVEEEKFIDFEDPMAKWTSAIGGFAGFVAGAPLKVGAKFAQLAAKPFIKAVGKESVDTVVRGMKQAGREGGLSRKAIRGITGGYKTLVKKSQIDPTLRGKQFSDHASKYMNNYISRAGLQGAEKEAVQRMFSNNVMRRPLQDFIGVMAERGIASPALARVLGHSINDALMFGMIDTVFEGVSVIEDHEYDWTAPLWGVGTGLMFGQLGWLSPRGKGAGWLKDFKDGVRGAFAKSPYTKMDRGQLEAAARFMGESSEHYGQSTLRDVAHKGVNGRVNLKSDHIYDEFKSIFKGEADDALKLFLNTERRIWGRELMKWSTKESFQNLQSNWLRMTLGGVLFNAHTFYDMYAHDYDADVSDILPHFLIGAYVQRSANPARFDLNATRMNQIRQNLITVEYSPAQLSEIPSFAYSPNRFENPFNHPKFKGAKDLANELNITTNNFEATEVRLPEGEISIEVKNTENVRIFKDHIYPWMLQSKNGKKHIKPKDAISVKEADAIVEKIKEADSSLKTYKDFEATYDNIVSENTKDFEREFTDIIDEIRASGGDIELDIVYDPSRPRDNQVPKHVRVSDELVNRAKNGELDFLVDTVTGEVLSGEKAENQLREKVDGLNKILTTAVLLRKTQRMPQGEGNDMKAIESEEFLRSAYNTIVKAENRINNSFPDNASYADRFTFNNNFNDYVTVLERNYAKKSAEKVFQLLSPQSPDRDRLSGLLGRAGLIHQPEGESVGRIRSDLENVKVVPGTDKKTELEVAEAQRLLNRLLPLQSLAGGYEVIKDAPYKEVSVNEVNALNNFLAKRSFDLKKINPSMHEALYDYFVKDKIKRTDLTLPQTDAIFDLATMNMGGFESAVEGKAAGFFVKLIDESFVPKGSEDNASKYNRYVKQIIEDGKGLVRTEGDPVKVVDGDFVTAALRATESTVNNIASRAKLMEFMSMLPAEKTPFSSFQKKLATFIEEPGNVNLAFKMLRHAGVIKDGTKKAGRKFIIDEESMKFFTQELASKMGNKFDSMGVTQKYAEQRYVELEQGARDRLIQDVDEYSHVKHVDLDTFYKRYRIDGKDPDSIPQDAQLADFQSLVYTSVENRLLTPDVINKVLDSIHVKKADDYVKFKELELDEQNRRKPGIIEDIVGLLSTQRAQVKLDVIKFKNGQLSKDTEIAQITRFREYLTDGLDIPYYVVDPFTSIYELVDNRYVRLRYVDMFRASDLTNVEIRRQVEAYKREFERLLAPKSQLFGESIQGENGELGVTLMRLSPNLEPIAIESRHLDKIRKPFLEFAKRYGENTNISEQSRKVIRELQSLSEGTEPITNVQYEQMLRRLTFENMLTGSDGNRTFIEFLNGESTEKTMSRIKLYNTKKFVRHNKDFVLDVADTYGSIGDKQTERVLRRIIRNDGFGVAVWNDEGYATIRAEVEKQVKELGIDWKWEDVIGEAHNDVSAFDSISYVSKDMIRYLHSIIGHNPNSVNPIKPVVSSGGKKSPLLLGKTLFIHSDALDGFFKQNPELDILMTKTGAKSLNPVGKAGELDASIINKPWERLTGDARPGQRVGQSKIRKISIDSIGILPSKDAEIVTAKDSMSDHNYRDNTESKRAFESEYADVLSRNLDNMNFIAQDPISMREFILKEMGNEFLSVDAAGGEGLNQLSNLFFFSSLSRDANPMSYSEAMVKNKMYGMYVDGLINNKRSVTNQFSPEDSHTTGGQSILIQAPSSEFRLRSTFVGKDGKLQVRGQVLLPNWAGEMSVIELIDSGYEMRMIRGSEVLTPQEVFGEKMWKELYVESNLRSLHESLDYQISQGEIPQGTEIGVIVNRKPRTRPNDMALLGLKGFLKKGYGNSISLSSLDVVNVFEGDYDVDKADFFFSARKNTYDHVKRASQFFVQGVDPTNLKSTSNFHMGMTASSESEAINRMAANNDLFKSSIGIVQKVPRMLGYLSKLGSVPADIKKDLYLRDYVRKLDDGSDYAPKVLFSGKDFRITLDYENTDWFTRSALETQYIIDGTGKLNPDIARDIYSWRDTFLFPRIEDSIVPGDASINRPGFINDMRSQGHSNNKRVRIFRKFEKQSDGSVQEVELTRLEQSMVKELLSEYGNLLNATGSSLFENSGESRRPKYEDVVNASERFFNFNKNVSDNLYYRLRRRRVDPTDPKSKKWYQEREFKDLFEVDEISYKDKITGEKKKAFKPTRKVVDTSVERNGLEFSEGKRGAVIDRVMQRLYESDPFELTRNRSMTGESRQIMDEWFAQLHGATGEDWSSSIDKLNNDIADLSMSHNQKIRTIGSLKRKIMQIGSNYKVPYATRQKSIGKLNKVIREIEKELTPLIEKKYWKTRKTADLDKIRYVSVSKEELRRATIEFHTMDNLNKMLPLIDGDVNFGLGPRGVQDLKSLKQLRSLFYSNNTNLGDVLKYGDKTLISGDMRKFLENIPDISTFYQIETELLKRGRAEHGVRFIYSFMQHAQSKYNVGVFDGNAVTIPYDVNGMYAKRYSRGLKFLTELAREGIPGMEGDTAVQSHAKQSLRMIQLIESQFERFYNRKFDMRNVVGENIGDAIDVSEIGYTRKAMIMDNIRMPDFNKDVQDAFTGFRSIQWSRGNRRITNGFGLTNDYLLDFYSDIMRLAGKEKDFESYLHSMHDIEAQMISNNIVDPLKYLAKRSMIEGEVKDIMQDVLTGGITADTNNPVVRNLINNPVYAIMGGRDYFRGLVFEKQSKLSIDRLRQMKDMYENLENSRNKTNMNTDKVRRQIDEVLGRCKGK